MPAFITLLRLFGEKVPEFFGELPIDVLALLVAIWS